MDADKHATIICYPSSVTFAAAGTYFDPNVIVSDPVIICYTNTHNDTCSDPIACSDPTANAPAQYDAYLAACERERQNVPRRRQR